MRTELSPLDGKKSVFYATFDRFGWRKFMGQYVGRTLLLKDIRDRNGNVLTDHLWFKMGKGFEKLGLKKGDIVSFHARVGTYAKGRRRRTDAYDATTYEASYDYHLEHPEHLVKVNDEMQMRL